MGVLLRVFVEIIWYSIVVVILYTVHSVCHHFLITYWCQTVHWIEHVRLSNDCLDKSWNSTKHDKFRLINIFKTIYLKILTPNYTLDRGHKLVSMLDSDFRNIFKIILKLRVWHAETCWDREEFRESSDHLD